MFTCTVFKICIYINGDKERLESEPELTSWSMGEEDAGWFQK